MWMATVGALHVATALDPDAAVSWEVDPGWGLGLATLHGPALDAVAAETAELAAWWTTSRLVAHVQPAPGDTWSWWEPTVAAIRSVPQRWRRIIAGVMLGATPPHPVSEIPWQAAVGYRPPLLDEIELTRNTLDLGAGQATLWPTAHRIAKTITPEGVREALTTEQGFSVVHRTGLRWTGMDALDWLALLGLGGAPWTPRPKRYVWWPVTEGVLTAQILDAVVDGTMPYNPNVRWHRATIEREFHPDGYRTHQAGRYGHLAANDLMPPGSRWTPWAEAASPWAGRRHNVGLLADVAMVDRTDQGVS